jgi:hypothetical protein
MPELASWAVGSDSERIVDVEDARAALSAVLAPSATIAARAGFLAGPATQGQVTASGTPDVNVTVAAFQAVLANSRGIFPYVVTLDAPETVDVLVDNPSDPTNARRDLIIAQQSDAYYGDASSPFEIKRVTGTPAASPSDPTVTGSPDYLLLARITVPAGATTITGANITDLRPSLITVARGGTIPCTAATRPASPHPGMRIFETDTGIERVWNATTGNWEAVFGAVSNIMTTSLPIRTTAAGDVSLSSTTHPFQLGPTSGINLRADGEEIQAVNNGAASTMRLNPSGGPVQVGSGGLSVDGITTITPTTGTASQAMAFNHSYRVYVDNINTEGAAGSRFWLDVPNGGDVVIGPRSSSSWIRDLRLRTDLTTSSSANLFINSASGTIARFTSAQRYKTDIVDLALDLAAVRALRPVRYRDRGEVDRDGDEARTHVGFIAEEVDELGLGEFVHYRDTEDGPVPDGIQYDRIVVAQHMLIADLEARVAALAARLDALEGQA